MKKLLLISSLVAVLMLLAAGCSDDDECPTCPQFVQKALMMAEIETYDGEIQMWGSIFGLNGRLPDIDSVKLEGMDVEMHAAMDAGASYYYLQYNAGGEFSKPSDWASGDTVLVEVFTPDGKCESRCTLLDSEEDEPEIIGWSSNYPYDTVEVNTSITIDWHPIDGADYYYLSVNYEYDSAGTYEHTSHWVEIHDTTYTIPASDLDYNGRLYMDLGPVSGPSMTSSAGNITGGFVKGWVVSTTYDYFTIYVGTGDPYPAGAEVNEEQRPHQTILEAAHGVIKR